MGNSKGMQPNVVSYTTVVTAYANARPPRVQDAERVVLQMEQNGVIANEVTYNSLIKAYASQKPAQPHKAEEILVRMERLGIRPDVISCSSLATSYGNAEKVDTVAAENVLTRMREKGIVGNTITYSSVVAAFSNKSPSDPVGAERVIQKMIDNNIKCNTITYCNLICAYRNAGRAAEAACVLDRMAAAGVKADAVCYNAVIKAFSNLPLGKPGFLEAFAVAERMQNDDIVPNIVTANVLPVISVLQCSLLPKSSSTRSPQRPVTSTHIRACSTSSQTSAVSLRPSTCSTRLVRILLAGQTNSCSRPAFVPAHLTATSSSRSGIRMHATRASRRPVFMFRSAIVKASTVVQSPTRSSASKTATHRRPIDQQYTKKSKK